MNAAVLERDMFAPQQPPGMRSGLALAILAHVLLIIALTFSVNWKASEPEGVVAELWSAVPQTAAPRPTPPVVKPEPTPPVVKVMDALQRAGIQRVGLSVKSQRSG